VRAEWTASGQQQFSSGAPGGNSGIVGLELWAQLNKGDIDRGKLAAQEEVTPSYILRVLPLAFLAPSVVDAILEDKPIAALDGQALTAPGAVAMDWSIQHRRLLGAVEAGR
jgi:hypothetical protein